MVVDELNVGQLQQYGRAVAQLEPQFAGAADDLLGRNAVGLFGKGTHELDAPSGNDEGFEAIRAQICEQFEHRLINHLGIKPTRFGMLRRGEPIFYDTIELIGRHSAVRAGDNFQERVLAAGQHHFHVAFED